MGIERLFLIDTAGYTVLAGVELGVGLELLSFSVESGDVALDFESAGALGAGLEFLSFEAEADAVSPGFETGGCVILFPLCFVNGQITRAAQAGKTWQLKKAET